MTIASIQADNFQTRSIQVIHLVSFKSFSAVPLTLANLYSKLTTELCLQCKLDSFAIIAINRKRSNRSTNETLEMCNSDEWFFYLRGVYFVEISSIYIHSNITDMHHVQFYNDGNFGFRKTRPQHLRSSVWRSYQRRRRRQWLTRTLRYSANVQFNAKHSCSIDSP